MRWFIAKVHLGLVQHAAWITMSMKNIFNINSTVKSGSGPSEHGNKIGDNLTSTVCLEKYIVLWTKTTLQTSCSLWPPLSTTVNGTM